MERTQGRARFDSRLRPLGDALDGMDSRKGPPPAGGIMF